MTNERTDDARQIIDLLQGAKLSMVTTVGSSGLQAHPMTIQQVDDEGNLWFFLPESSEQARNVQADPRVNVAVSTGDSWVSASGDGVLITDRAKIDELWDGSVGSYFDGKDDPQVTLLHVTTVSGEYWDTPGGKITALGSYLKSKVTGEQVDGDNAEARLD